MTGNVAYHEYAINSGLIRQTEEAWYTQFSFFFLAKWTEIDVKLWSSNGNGYLLVEHLLDDRFEMNEEWNYFSTNLTDLNAFESNDEMVSFIVVKLISWPW